MPVSINDTIIMGDDGKLTADFKPEMLGEDYKDSKFFNDRADILAIMTSAVANKSALDKKLDKVIQKPGENASDEDVATYHKSLRAELGAPEDPNDYAFSDDSDEKAAEYFRSVFAKIGLPVSDAEMLVTAYNEFQEAITAEAAQEASRKYDEGIAEFKKAHPGDDLVASTRIATRAMLEFGSEELQKAIKESGLPEKPDNFEAWKKLGFDASQIAVWVNIGKKMKSDTPITDEGRRAASEDQAEKDKISATYDHPTSVRDRQERGVA